MVLAFVEDLNDVPVGLRIQQLENIRASRQDLSSYTRNFDRLAECHDSFLVPLIGLRPSWKRQANRAKQKIIAPTLNRFILNSSWQIVETLISTTQHQPPHRSREASSILQTCSSLGEHVARLIEQSPPAWFRLAALQCTLLYTLRHFVCQFSTAHTVVKIAHQCRNCSHDGN